MVLRLRSNDVFETEVNQEKDFNIDPLSVEKTIAFPVRHNLCNYAVRTWMPLAKQYYINMVPPYVKHELKEWSMFKLYPDYYDGTSNHLWINTDWWTPKLDASCAIYNHFDNAWLVFGYTPYIESNLEVFSNNDPKVFIKVNKHDSYTFLERFFGWIYILVRVNSGKPVLTRDPT